MQALVLKFMLQFANMIILALGGFLCDMKSVDGGWPTLFYLTGGISVLFCILWWFCIFDSPSDHPRISKQELDFINHYDDSRAGNTKV